MSIASYWRTREQRLTLTGEVCPHCGVKLFPPRDICPECSGHAGTLFRFSGKGEVYSFSTMYSAPQEFDQFVPYVVAIVKLDEGPLVTAQLTDVDKDKVHIGMPVKMVTRKIREEGENGLILYNYKFRPLLQPVGV